MLGKLFSSTYKTIQAFINEKMICDWGDGSVNPCFLFLVFLFLEKNVGYGCVCLYAQHCEGRNGQ